MHLHHLAKYLTLARFEVFYHVPDSEKKPLFRKFIRAPFEEVGFREVLNQIFNTNQFAVLQNLMRNLSRSRKLRNDPNKDLDLILTLFWQESDPQIAHQILLHCMRWDARTPAKKEIQTMAQNLLFSAGCPQDKWAALCLLEE